MQRVLDIRTHLVGHILEVRLNIIDQIATLLLHGIKEFLLIGQVQLLLKLSTQVVDERLGFLDVIGQLKGLRTSLLALDIASRHNFALRRDQENG